ncbi:MAG: TIGR03557 family F420-dependent LLM class oxidoreductase [Actinobacteria bacterium]|nr:TIGR03557 family F420-dependent LLM class oxidoreductase [Actinomycetota bacterium]
MPAYGFKLMTELHGPAQLVRQAEQAEQAGFDFAGISDHIHPWLESHHHSPFAWSVLGAIAERTSRLELVTMVTCPTVRYHPAVIAQAAATIGVLSHGRFTLGLGSGEQLNEHVVGKGWPPVDVRHDMLAEAVQAIRQLWQGGYQTFRGQHVTVEDARIFDLPNHPVRIALAVSGRKSVELAAELADGIVATEAEAALVDGFARQGGDRRNTWAEVAVSWHPDEAEARRIAHERLRFSAQGWKVMAELPNVANFEAAAEPVTEDQMAESVPCGSDPKRFAAALHDYVDAGFEHVAVLPAGDDIDGFLRFWTDEVRPLLP